MRGNKYFKTYILWFSISLYVSEISCWRGEDYFYSYSFHMNEVSILEMVWGVWVVSRTQSFIIFAACNKKINLIKKKKTPKVIPLNNNVALHTNSFVDPLAGNTTRRTIVKNCNNGWKVFLFNLFYLSILLNWCWWAINIYMCRLSAALHSYKLMNIFFIIHPESTTEF